MKSGVNSDALAFGLSPSRAKTDVIFEDNVLFTAITLNSEDARAWFDENGEDYSVTRHSEFKASVAMRDLVALTEGMKEDGLTIKNA